MNKSGFTLIELSIALVIIGLIVGGVLVGRDLQEAAKMRGVVTFFTQTEAAILTYRGRYKELPGDDPDAYERFAGGDDTICGPHSSHPTVPFNACNGNGDGSIDNRESVRAFHHMQLAGIINYKLNPSRGDLINISHGEPGISLRNQWPDVIIPSVGLNNAGAVMANFGYTTCNEEIVVGSSTDGGGNFVNDYRGVEAITALNAYGLDTKIDDGVPNTGKFAASGASWGSCGPWQGTHIAQSYDVSKPANRGCAIHWCAYR